MEHVCGEDAVQQDQEVRSTALDMLEQVEIYRSALAHNQSELAGLKECAAPRSRLGEERN